MVNPPEAAGGSLSLILGWGFVVAFGWLYLALVVPQVRSGAFGVVLAIVVGFFLVTYAFAAVDLTLDLLRSRRHK